MRPTIKHQAFLDLEDSLTKRVSNHTTKNLAPIWRQLAAQVARKDWAAAHQTIDQIDLGPVVAKNLKYLETLGTAALLLGASRLAKPRDSIVYQNLPTFQLQNAIKQYSVLVGQNATESLKLRGHLMLAKLEMADDQAKQVYKADFGNADLVVAGLLNPEQSQAPYKRRKLAKYNENHDPKTGEFTTGGGSYGPKTLEEINASFQDFRNGDNTRLDLTNLKNGPDALARVWQKVMPNVTPTDVITAMTGSGDFSTRSIGISVSPYSVSVKVGIGNVYGATTHNIDRVFYPDGTVVHSYFRIASGQQGAGAGRQMMAASMQMYQAMGIKTVLLGADLDAGGYAWARYGFYPASSGETKVPATQALDNIKAAVASEQAAITPEANAELTALSALVDSANKANRLDTLTLMADAKTPNLDKFLKSDFEWHNIPHGTAVKLGLRNVEWNGKLNLNNPEQMSRFWTYVRSKK